MTQSMTGFARASVTTDSAAVIVELRSVNHRFLDVHFRCPESLRSEEPHWRMLLSKSFERGKIEVNCKVQLTPGSDNITIDTAKLAQLKGALDEIALALPEATAPDALTLLQSPGIATTEQLPVNGLKETAEKALSSAIVALTEQRQNEGLKLAGMVIDRVTTMASLLAALKLRLPLLREQQQQRLVSRLEQSGVEADAKRLEEELVYLAQRSDVEEEMDRLAAHLDAIISAINGDKPCGRRLDFFMQELNREANTLSSKSTALSTTNTAVEFKVLIEQMREQIQNIE